MKSQIILLKSYKIIVDPLIQKNKISKIIKSEYHDMMLGEFFYQKVKDNFSHYIVMNVKALKIGENLYQIKIYGKRASKKTINSLKEQGFVFNNML